MNMDYSKAFELLSQDAENERNKKAEKAVKAERNRWVGKLFDLKDKMRNQHEAFYEAEDYDSAYGLSTAMDMIDNLIKEELQGSR